MGEDRSYTESVADTKSETTKEEVLLPWQLNRRGTQPYGVPIIINADNVDKLEERIRQMVDDSRGVHIFGFDAEWVDGPRAARLTSWMKPSTKQEEIWKENAANGKIALIQLSSPFGYTILVRVCFFTDLPQCLVNFLVDRTMLKVGVGIHDDCERMHKDWSVCPKGYMDIRNLIEVLPEFADFSTERNGLKALAAHLFQTSMDDFYNARISNWYKYEGLERYQIDYAARDSQAGADIAMWSVAHTVGQLTDGASQQQYWQSTAVEDYPSIFLKFYTYCESHRFIGHSFAATMETSKRRHRPTEPKFKDSDGDGVEAGRSSENAFDFVFCQLHSFPPFGPCAPEGRYYEPLFGRPSWQRHYEYHRGYAPILLSVKRSFMEHCLRHKHSWVPLDTKDGTLRVYLRFSPLDEKQVECEMCKRSFGRGHLTDCCPVPNEFRSLIAQTVPAIRTCLCSFLQVCRQCCLRIHTLQKMWCNELALVSNITWPKVLVPRIDAQLQQQQQLAWRLLTFSKQLRDRNDMHSIYAWQRELRKLTGHIEKLDHYELKMYAEQSIIDPSSMPEHRTHHVPYLILEWWVAACRTTMSMTRRKALREFERLMCNLCYSVTGLLPQQTNPRCFCRKIVTAAASAVQQQSTTRTVVRVTGDGVDAKGCWISGGNDTVVPVDDRLASSRSATGDAIIDTSDDESVTCDEYGDMFERMGQRQADFDAQWYDPWFEEKRLPPSPVPEDPSISDLRADQMPKNNESAAPLSTTLNVPLSAIQREDCHLSTSGPSTRPTISPSFMPYCGSSVGRGVTVPTVQSLEIPMDDSDEEGSSDRSIDNCGAICAVSEMKPSTSQLAAATVTSQCTSIPNKDHPSFLGHRLQASQKQNQTSDNAGGTARSAAGVERLAGPHPSVGSGAVTMPQTTAAVIAEPVPPPACPDSLKKLTIAGLIGRKGLLDHQWTTAVDSDRRPLDAKSYNLVGLVEPPLCNAALPRVARGRGHGQPKLPPSARDVLPPTSPGPGRGRGRAVLNNTYMGAS